MPDFQGYKPQVSGGLGPDGTASDMSLTEAESAAFAASTLRKLSA